MLRSFPLGEMLTVPPDAGLWALYVTDPGEARWLSPLGHAKLGVIPCGWNPISKPPRLCAGLEFTGNGTLYLLQGARPEGCCGDEPWVSDLYDLRGMTSGVVTVCTADRLGDSTGYLTVETSADKVGWDRITGFPDGLAPVGPKLTEKFPLYPVGLKRFIRFRYAPDQILAWGFTYSVELFVQGRHMA